MPHASDKFSDGCMSSEICDAAFRRAWIQDLDILASSVVVARSSPDGEN